MKPMPELLLCLAIGFTELNPELTSRAMVHMDYWASQSDVIWFACPQRLKWFETEARRVGALSAVSSLDLTQNGSLNASERIREHINQVRIRAFLEQLSVQFHPHK